MIIQDLKITYFFAEEEAGEDDPDVLQRDVIDRILEKELNRTTDTVTSSPDRNHTKKSSVYWEDEYVFLKNKDGYIIQINLVLYHVKFLFVMVMSQVYILKFKKNL